MYHDSSPFWLEQELLLFLCELWELFILVFSDNSFLVSCDFFTWICRYRGSLCRSSSLFLIVTPSSCRFWSVKSRPRTLRTQNFLPSFPETASGSKLGQSQYLSHLFLFFKVSPSYSVCCFRSQNSNFTYFVQFSTYLC